jgi:septum formation protein
VDAGPLWRGLAPLLLASTSLGRRAILQAAGLPVDAEASGIDERAVEAGLVTPDPMRLAARLARDKTEAVAARRPDRIVLGADQVLDLDGVPVAKPSSEVAARAQLARLAGRTHRLHSAAALAQDGVVVWEGLDSASLRMRPLDEDAITRYVAAAGEAATRSAGGYEIEALGIHLFDRIDGEHSVILGLPMLPLLDALRRMGLLAL